jgi:hypothetical protein
MDTAEDLSLLFGADAIRQLGEALVQPVPELEAIGDRGWHQNGTQARDVLVADLAANTVALNKAHQGLPPAVNCHAHSVAFQVELLEP